MIAVDRLSLTIHGEAILRDVSFTMAPGRPSGWSAKAARASR